MYLFVNMLYVVFIIGYDFKIVVVYLSNFQPLNYNNSRTPSGYKTLKGKEISASYKYFVLLYLGYILPL